MAASVVVTAAVVGDHLDLLRVERGLARSTVAAYRRDLGQYVAFLDGRPPDADLVSEFVSALRERGLADSTIARKVAAVRGLHRWMVAEGIVSSDPTALLDTPQRGTTLPKALTIDEAIALVEAPDVSTPAGRRDRALLEFLYATGARVSEAVGVDELDVDLSEGLVVLTGKGDKQRIVPLGESARRAIEAWNRDRAGIRTARSGSALFLSLRGRRLTRQSAWDIVRSAAEGVGIAVDRVSPHVLRHSAATHMVEGGADLRSVQELLGHATIATTQIYTRVSPQHLLEVYTTSHPRS